MTKPKINKDKYISSLELAISDTYEDLKYWKKQQMNCTSIIKGAFLIDTYSEEYQKKIDEYSKLLKEKLEEYNRIKDFDEEQLTKYLNYRDLKKELDL